MAGESRGKLIIFLGSRSRGGKDLHHALRGQAEAQERGDVKVAFIETHGREDTLEMIGEIPVIPAARLYTGEWTSRRWTWKRYWMHTQVSRWSMRWHIPNVPGSKHRKRYEDIEELLKNGIDVWTTVNIQHMESLNACLRIHGRQGQGDLPGLPPRQAEQVRLIDIDPLALIERIKAGKVYPPARSNRPWTTSSAEQPHRAAGTGIT